MNAHRRKEIKRIALQLDALINMIDDIKSSIEGLRDEEQDAFDNLPESLQESERGQTMQEAIDALDEASLALPDLSEVIDYLSTASGD